MASADASNISVLIFTKKWKVLHLLDRSVISYNCRGFNSSMPDVNELLENYQIVFLQETWLAKQQLDKLSTI